MNASTVSGIKVVRRRAPREMVLPTLRRAILNGELPAGTRLNESDISRSLGVSRSPVREALARLEQEGLAERLPNRGAFVADVFSRRAIAELASLRSALETFAVQLASVQIEPEALERLYALTAELGMAVEQRDFRGIADVDFRFHRELVRLARHRQLYQAWTRVADQYWALYLPKVQELGRDIGRWELNHRLIVDALAERRPDLATMYLQYNILNSADHLREYLPEMDGVVDRRVAAEAIGRLGSHPIMTDDGEFP